MGYQHIRNYVVWHQSQKRLFLRRNSPVFWLISLSISV